MSQTERTSEIINQEIQLDTRFERLSETAKRAFVDYVAGGVQYYHDPSQENFDKLNNPVGRVQTHGAGDMALSTTLRVIARLNKGEGQLVAPSADFIRGDDEDAGEYLEKITRVQPWRMFETRGELTAEMQHQILVFGIINEMNNDGRGDDALDIVTKSKDKDPLPFNEWERLRYKR